MLVMVAVGTSWYVHEYNLFGSQFIEAHFGWVIVTRGFNLEEQSWYDHLTYVQDLMRYYWPWLPVFLISIVVFMRKAWRRDQPALLLTLWSLLLICIMSVMQSRVLWYLMPMFPASSIMCGQTMGNVLSDAWKVRIAKVLFGLTIIVAIVLNVTPVALESDRERDVRQIAPYVRELSASGAEVIAFRQDYYGLNNSLLFYADAAAFPLFQDYSSLSRAMASDTLKACIVNVREFGGVRDNVSNVYVVKQTAELVVCTNHPFEVTISP
jgi:hypothetical protein